MSDHYFWAVLVCLTIQIKRGRLRGLWASLSWRLATKLTSPRQDRYHHRAKGEMIIRSFSPDGYDFRSSFISSSMTDKYNRQTAIAVTIDQRGRWPPDNHCHWSEDSTDYTSGENLVIVRLRLSINTDAPAVANHSDGLLSSVEVDVPRFTMVIPSKNILYACSDNALYFPRAYSFSLVYFPR
jgi:hypothetical protein